MKTLMKKIIYPNKCLGWLFFNLGMGLLIYVFAKHLENTFLAYISYLLSTYALILFCAWFYKACKFSNDFIKQRKLYRIYITKTKTFTKISLLFSLFINLIYGLLKLVLGLYYKSEWFITFAVYYLLLCFMRVSLVHNIKKEDLGQNLEIEYKKLKHTGIILLFLDVVLSGIIFLIVHQNQIIHYPGYLIYIVALYDFYLIISAFLSVLKYKKKNSPILTASKCIRLTVAMISIISLEVAMIYQFGNNDMDFKRIMTSCTGFGICLINSFMAIYMIKKANNYSQCQKSA